MKLWDAVRKLQHEAFQVTHVESLTYLSEERVLLIDQFESESETAHDFVLRRSRQLIELCEELEKTLDADQLMELKNQFSELLMFVKIRKSFSVERLPEGAEKTPDFQIKFRNREFFVENKALNVAGGGVKHREIMDEGLEKKIDLWKQIEGGAGVAVNWQVITPVQDRF